MYNSTRTGSYTHRLGQALNAQGVGGGWYRPQYQTSYSPAGEIYTGRTIYPMTPVYTPYPAPIHPFQYVQLPCTCYNPSMDIDYLPMYEDGETLTPYFALCPECNTPYFIFRHEVPEMIPCPLCNAYSPCSVVSMSALLLIVTGKVVEYSPVVLLN